MGFQKRDDRVSVNMKVSVLLSACVLVFVALRWRDRFVLCVF